VSRFHRLKCAHEPFEALKAGKKTAEFRYNDRSYQVGDLLFIYDGTGEDFATYPCVVRVITHIVRGPAFGIPDRYAMLSVKPA
jgi:hypothetical protein